MKKNNLLLSVFSLLLTCSGCGNTPNPTINPSPDSSGSGGVSVEPTVQPTIEPTVDSTTQPTMEPTVEPTVGTTTEPSGELYFDTSKRVEITFYHTMNQYLKEILDYNISMFNQIYPNIIVTNVSAGDYDGVEDQLVTSISAGKQVCDMAYCYPDHVALYNKANAVLTLDKYINDSVYGFTDEQIEDFVDAYWEEGKSFGDGQMYSLPLSKSTEVMYYDMDFFAEHNLQVPDHWFATTTNVDDDKTSMEYVCKYIKSVKPNDYALGYDSSSNLFITLCEQYGSGYTSATGEHYLFDNETNRDFVTRLADWYKKGYFTTKGIYGQYTSNLFKNQDATSSRCYMSIGSSAGASNQVPDGYVYEVGVAKIPQVNPNDGKVISQGPNVCIFKNKDEQKNMACWLLLRYLTTSIDFQAEFSMQSGYAPVIESVYDNDIYLEFLDCQNGYDFITARANMVALEQEDWYYTSPAFVGSSQARDAVGSLLDSVLQGTQTVDEAFKTALNELKSS